MKIPLLSLVLFWVGTLATAPAYGQALDPSFQSPVLYRPAAANAVVSQPDGKVIVVGSFIRTDAGAFSQVLVRYNADHTVDQAFAGNVATLSGRLYNVRVLTSGKLLLIGEGTLTHNGIIRQDIMRLNSDGTPDASFDAGLATATGWANVSAVQADGKILLGGSFTVYNGVASKRIVRLLADGSVDASFMGGNQFDDYVEEITLQADGKILVGGAFDTPVAVARLLPNGALDPAFSSPLIDNSVVNLIGVQSDGSILLGGSWNSLYFKNNITMEVARLMPDGTTDPTFFGGTDRTNNGIIYNDNDALEFVVQPDGRIVVAIDREYDKTPTHDLLRLNVNGTIDSSFSSPFASNDNVATITCLHQLANGQLIIAGSYFQSAGRRNNVLVLNANGSLDLTFNPLLLTPGFITSLIRQTDGKVVAGGTFDEVNSVRAKGLARLNLDGSLDATFTTQISTNFYVTQVGVQPDGKIIFCGGWPITGNSTGSKIFRLLSTGAADNSFQPASSTSVDQFAVQADGRIIVSDYVGVKRLLANGQIDNSFTVGVTNGNVYRVAIQPDGKILVGGDWHNYNGSTTSISLARLLPNGALDPTFTSPFPTSGQFGIDELLLQPDGKVLVAAYDYNATTSAWPWDLVRVLPSGALDNSFTAKLPVIKGKMFVRTMAVQADGRILVAPYKSGLVRLQVDGQPDASFGSLGFNSDVEDILVQPDGKIMVGGYFTTVGNQAAVGLARIMPSGTLHVANQQLEARTQAWPVPAHETLNLSLDAAAQPQSVQLLDNLGRTVLTRQTTQTELRLPLRQVKAGVYLLRVNYASGPVTRRVVVE